MIFWRILDNKLYNIGDVEKLGFDKDDGVCIPDEYLDKQEFMVMRTAHGIGDWGIISAIPRLLKEKYPDCKVYVPSKKLLSKLFEVEHKNVSNILSNNPYVDYFVDDKAVNANEWLENEEKALEKVKTKEHTDGVQVFDPLFPYAKEILDQLNINPKDYTPREE